MTRRRMNAQRLLDVYERLLRHRGHAGWWPGETAFEVCLGAILTQNTAWSNVEKALGELRRRALLSYEALAPLSAEAIAPLIRSSGVFNVKARRVRAFLDFLAREYEGRVEGMALEDPGSLRRKLLAVEGIGPETADSIALYAAGHPLFVIDAYTHRVFGRLGLLHGGERYEAVQQLFVRALPADAGLFGDYHAQIVLLGKDHCRRRPRCEGCPLDPICPRRGVEGGAKSLRVLE